MGGSGTGGNRLLCYVINVHLTMELTLNIV